MFAVDPRPDLQMSATPEKVTTCDVSVLASDAEHNPEDGSEYIPRINTKSDNFVANSSLDEEINPYLRPPATGLLASGLSYSEINPLPASKRHKRDGKYPFSNNSLINDWIC